MITSRHNAQVKLVRSLFTRKGRQRERLAPIEGVRAVAEVLDAGVKPSQVFLVSEWLESAPGGQEIVARLETLGVELTVVSEQLASDISDTESPQGITAVVPIRFATLRETFKAPGTIVVALAGLQDPGNLGTIIRSAECLGARGIVVLPGTVDPFNPKVLRSTVGGLFRIAVAQAQSNEFIDVARQEGFRVLTAEPGGGQLSWQVDWSVPTALIIGNEARGVRPALSKKADGRVAVPMQGAMESLNAAMATTILLYEAQIGARGAVRG